MPQIKQIIFLKDKSGEFKLRDDIRSFGFDDRRGQFYVQFKKGDNYLFYNPSNVDVAEFTRQLEPPFRITRKTDGEVFFHVLGVRVFEGRENNAYRIIFENGAGKNYPVDYVDVEEHIDDHRSINVWEYLNEVAKYNVIHMDDDKTVSLADKYAKMEFVAKNSLLEAYLNVETYVAPTTGQSAPIFPFGCNRSQYKAVRNALENRISVIQGPPGTGKTQTILNILANLLLDGRTMEIVSNNNSAVENVKEKLEASGLDFLCAQLGRASNKKEFVEAQTGAFPDISSWKLSNAKTLRQEAVALSREMQELYECQENLLFAPSGLHSINGRSCSSLKRSKPCEAGPVKPSRNTSCSRVGKWNGSIVCPGGRASGCAIISSLPRKMLRMNFNTCSLLPESQRWRGSASNTHFLWRALTRKMIVYVRSPCSSSRTICPGSMIPQRQGWFLPPMKYT